MIEHSPYVDSRASKWKSSSYIEGQKFKYTTPLHSSHVLGAMRIVSRPARSFSPSEKLIQNLSRLKEFARAEKGWNGYNAKQFDKRALNNAQELLFQFQSQQPFISPLTDGGLQFDWENGERTLEMEIYADCFNFLDDSGNETVFTDKNKALAHIKSWLNG